MNVATLASACSVDGHKITYSRLRNRIWFDKASGGPSFKLRAWMAQLNAALRRANCNTPDRVAMFLAQLGAESGSFRWTEELASGAEYENRTDLGNVEVGDGVRFKGRTYIQITGRHNYTALSEWAHAKGFLPKGTTRRFFVNNPEKLADVAYIFLGPVWYWTVARDMNQYADHGDIEGATRAVNGGLNNLSGRTLRWNHARAFGNALLPSPAKRPVKKPVAKPTRHRTHQGASSYVVQPGDTLGGIAASHNTTWQRLQRLNHLSDPNRIFVGQRLRLY